MLVDRMGHAAGAVDAVVPASPVFLAVGVGVVAVATLAGAWLAHRRGSQQHVWFGVAAGALLVIAVGHLFPDAWSGAATAGLPGWLVPGVAVASFVITLEVSRIGCTCQADEEHASGAWSAAALAVHRFLEGAALGLTGVITAVAIAVHALGEGLAVGALLRAQRGRLACWLTLMCLGPAVGAMTADSIPSLQVSEPLLLAIAAGIVAQAARISLRAAFPHHARRSRLLASAAAVAVSAAATTLALFATG
jgi:zinc transporter ZupT